MWARRSVRYLACIDLSEGGRVSLHAFLPFRLPVNLIAIFIDQTEGERALQAHSTNHTIEWYAARSWTTKRCAASELTQGLADHFRY